MKNITKTIFIFSFVIVFFSCGKEEPIPDKSIGEWKIYSLTDESGDLIIWDELKETLVDLISEYSCMEFTATITEQIVSTKYVFVDVNSRGCLSPSISVFDDFWALIRRHKKRVFYSSQFRSAVNHYLPEFNNLVLKGH